jgi:hypothetical protein
MDWAVKEFPNPNGERFSYIGERPPNKFGWLWEYNCGVVQAAWAAWMERSSPDEIPHPCKATFNEWSKKTELRIVAKRNLARLIELGSGDKDLMLKCLEELT